MNISKISDEVMQDIFAEAFEQNIARYNNLTEYEAIIKRSARETEVLMEVTITGMAGSPTLEDFRDGRVEGADKLHVIDQRGELEYDFVPELTITQNSTDYIVTYRLVQG